MKNNMINILKKELRELFRDKKSLAMMLIIPIFIPLIMIGMSALFEMQANKDIEEYNKIGFAYKLSEEEKSLAEQMNIEVITGTEEELKQKYDAEEINAYVTQNEKNYIINTDGSDNSTFASNLMEEYFNSYKQILQGKYLEENGIEAGKVLDIITVSQNALEQDNYFGDYIKNYAFFIHNNGNNSICNIPSNRYNGRRKRKRNIGNFINISNKKQRYNSRKIFGSITFIHCNRLNKFCFSNSSAICSKRYVFNLWRCRYNV